MKKDNEYIKTYLEESIVAPVSFEGVQIGILEMGKPNESGTGWKTVFQLDPEVKNNERIKEILFDGGKIIIDFIGNDEATEMKVEVKKFNQLHIQK